MKQTTGCDFELSCPAVHDDGDLETVVVVGAMLTHRELTAMSDKIGLGETAVRVPRSVIMDAGLLLAAAEKIRKGGSQE